jgi:hypothetical protein
MAKFHNMTKQGQDRIVREGEKDISDYVYDMLFEDNNQRVSDILQSFESMEHYRLVVDEVRTWSGLVADEFIENASGEYKDFYPGSRETIKKIIERYVLEQVDCVVKKTPPHLRGTANKLFLRLHDILDTGVNKDHAEQQFSFILGLINSRLPEKDKPKKEKNKVRHYLKHKYGGTVKQLQKECEAASARIKEALRTDNDILLAYLDRHDADLKRYSALKQKENTMQLISELDEAVKYTQMFHPDENGIKIRNELGSFVKRLVCDYERYHSSIFDQRIAEMRELVESINPNETSSYQLIERLAEYIENAPRSFYKEEILSGNSPVEKFEHPEFVKTVLRGEIDMENLSEDDIRRYYKELVYLLGIGGETVSGIGGIDRVFAPLAEMLVAQKNKADENDWGSFVYDYCEYVGDLGGNPYCLEGMESETLEFKSSFLSVLIYNTENNINDRDIFERRLRKDFLEAKNPEQKNYVLRQARKTLNDIKANEEVLT